MRNLEQSIAEWRQTMSAARDIGPDTLDELETHLRETVEQFVRSGVSEAEAFPRAVTQLGPPAAVVGEFRKLSAFSWWPVRIVTALWVVEILYLVCSAWDSFDIEIFGLKATIALSVAIELVVLCLGASAVILHGVLGACFVMQRCYSDFSPRRLQALSRVSRSFAWVGAGLIIFDLFWGMIDGSDLGVQAWSVVVCLAGFLAAHYSRRVSARDLFLASLFTSNILLMCWFRPWSYPGPHSFGSQMSDPWMLGSTLLWILNLFVFGVGLAPAGWLRMHRT